MRPAEGLLCRFSLLWRQDNQKRCCRLPSGAYIQATIPGFGGQPTQGADALEAVLSHWISGPGVSWDDNISSCLNSWGKGGGHWLSGSQVVRCNLLSLKWQSGVHMYTHSLCRTKWTPSMSPNFTSSNFLTLLLGGGLLCTPSRYTHPHRCISSHSCLPPSGRPHLAPPTSASPSDLLHLLHPLVYALSANPWDTPPPPQCPHFWTYISFTQTLSDWMKGWVMEWLITAWVPSTLLLHLKPGVFLSSFLSYLPSSSYFSVEWKTNIEIKEIQSSGSVGWIKYF